MIDKIVIRPIERRDYPLLEEFLYRSIFVPEGVEPPAREIIRLPEIYVYIDGFGGEGDTGVVAEADGQVVGAAWTRIIPAYGQIDPATPELAISVLPQWRGQGIGGRMMERLFGMLNDAGYRRTSLSVQQDNPAVRLYQRLGYVITGERPDGAGHEDYLMTKELD
ncbi:MAG: GNAT family N-acetyltransferase [Alistipes sp.]|jgi:ribosomal protein S18 acetylase RimI-like enzyme|nr:GNAT family N-acetyltransferase [Alistipes sp.]